ncbi:MAG: hypothetical protein ACYTFK_06445 [Planctomycetota bacterium]|jgi:hypothetical protein
MPKQQLNKNKPDAISKDTLFAIMGKLSVHIRLKLLLIRNVYRAIGLKRLIAVFGKLTSV